MDTWTDLYRSSNKNLHPSALYGPRMLTKELTENNGPYGRIERNAQLNSCYQHALMMMMMMMKG